MPYKEPSAFSVKLQKQHMTPSVVNLIPEPILSNDTVSASSSDSEQLSSYESTPEFKPAEQISSPFYELTDEKHKQQWALAKRKQQEMIEKTHKTDFKIRAKDISKKVARDFGLTDIKNDFISIQADEDSTPKLYCLASRGNVLDRGNFGKVKLAKDENENVVAVKVIFRIKDKAQITQPKTQDELFELDVEKSMGISKGGFTRVSETKKNVNSTIIALGENKVIEKEYQVKEFLGKSLKVLLKEIKTGQTPDFTNEEKIEIGIKLIEAVMNMHNLNIIHRDLHAGNVMIRREEDGQLKVSLIDFGLAVRVKDTDSGYSQDKTRAYNSALLTPEQKTTIDSQGKIVAKIGTQFNRATDLYCAGKILGDNLGLYSNLSLLAPNAHEREPEKDIAQLKRFLIPPKNILGEISVSDDNYAVFKSVDNKEVTPESHAAVAAQENNTDKRPKESRQSFVPARESLKADSTKDQPPSKDTLTNKKPQSKI